MGTLQHLAARAGLSTVSLANTVLPKEITFLGRRSSNPVMPALDPMEGRRIVENALDWLGRVLEQGRALSSARPFGIFGTSISGMWLYGDLRDVVEFFVDEDPSRVGHFYEGRPILAPADTPADSIVYIPLNPDISVSVSRRLAGLPARFVPTPPYELSA